MSSDPKPGFYLHYKGGTYNVIGTGEHTERGERLVAYQDIAPPHEIWMRPLSMFTGRVAGGGAKRFERIEQGDTE